MLKKLPLLLLFLLLAGTSMAQSLRLSGTLRPQAKTVGVYAPWVRYSESPRRAVRRAPIKVGDNQLWWGYYKGGTENILGLGTSTAETYWAGIAIPTTEPLPRGKSIRAVRFIVAGKEFMENVYVWIADHLPKSQDANYTKVPVEMDKVVDNGFTEVELPTAYPLPAQTLYVGYSFNITSAGAEGQSSNFPVQIDYDRTNILGALLVRSSIGIENWTDPAESQVGYGKLALQVLLEGEFPRNMVETDNSFTDVFALANGTAEAKVKLISRSLGKIENISYVVTNGDKEGEEQQMDVEAFEGMDAETFVRIPLQADDTPGRTKRTITITKVNGVENEALAITEGYIVTLGKAVPRRTVIEEFTGTWCGWCPFGITGMQKINEQYADKAVTIIVHSDDPMAINYGITAPSFPFAYVDRGTAANPYYGLADKPLGILDLVGEMNQTLAEAEVHLQQPLLNKNGTVSFKADVTFHYSAKTSNYAMGYVLLADSLKGNNRNWAQANYFCQESSKAIYADDANLTQWTEGKAYMPMTFNRVAIAAKGMEKGVSGSITAPIVEDATRTVSSSFVLTGNTVMQDFDHLSVVAVLFNTSTNTIVNADIQPVAIANDFAQNKVQMKGFEQKTALKSSETTVSVPVANFGRNGIRDLDYIVRVDGVDSDTLHLDLSTPVTTFGVYQPIEFPVAAPAESGVQSHVIVLTKVNGAENEATSGKISSGSVITVAQRVERKTVIEEYTGTWCGWCPRGLQGLKRARAEYPDQAVLMSIHSGSTSVKDPMEVSAFSSLISGHSFPSAEVNRYRSVDPYMGEGNDGWGLGAVIEDEQSHLTEAAVELQQPILDEATGVINFTTDVTFQLTRSAAPYLLAYVLVADGLTGTGSGWTQMNYYPYYADSFADDPYMKEVTEWPMEVEGLVFDDVAIAANGIVSGVTNSLKATVQEGQVQSHTSKFSIKSNKLAQQATELRVLALLYDKTAKRFINADQKKVITTEEAAVRDVASDVAAREVSRYAIDGKRIARPVRGLNIVRMGDGSVRKVIVR